MRRRFNRHSVEIRWSLMSCSAEPAWQAGARVVSLRAASGCARTLLSDEGTPPEPCDRPPALSVWRVVKAEPGAAPRKSVGPIIVGVAGASPLRRWGVAAHYARDVRVHPEVPGRNASYRATTDQVHTRTKEPHVA